MRIRQTPCDPRREYVFASAPDAPGSAQVSLTMPVRLGSWVSRDFMHGQHLQAATIGIEVKATANPGASEYTGLRTNFDITGRTSCPVAGFSWIPTF